MWAESKCVCVCAKGDLKVVDKLFQLMDKCKLNNELTKHHVRIFTLKKDYLHFYHTYYESVIEDNKFLCFSAHNIYCCQKIAGVLLR
jgi:hypothetical protein